MHDELYHVNLKDIFEGPMDLLVHLIKKNEVDIHDIPIATITHQFLRYVEWIKLMDIDHAGDFLLMASTLTHIKSRTLLPKHELEEDEDPRLEITRPLMEYLQIKSAAEQLSDRPILGEHTFARKVDKKSADFYTEDQMINVGLFELIDAFQKILNKAGGEHRIDFSEDTISVKDRISELVDILEKTGSVTFESLFSGSPSRSEIIVTFLAILEMVKLSLIQLIQHVQTGIIRLFYQ
ncbi:MAG: segregation/condensation protein A [Desulfobacteraceae bacterium]|nr:segregation/condensation protein A [Desulfobacteraceae bacterium]